MFSPCKPYKIPTIPRQFYVIYGLRRIAVYSARQFINSNTLDSCSLASEEKNKLQKNIAINTTNSLISSWHTKSLAAVNLGGSKILKE